MKIGAIGGKRRAAAFGQDTKSQTKREEEEKEKKSRFLFLS